MCYCGCIHENYHGECRCNGKPTWNGECQRRRRAEEETERMESECPQPGEEGQDDA